jgi:hypothetical protein
MCLSSFLSIAADLPTRRAVMNVASKTLRDMTRALNTCGASTGLELLKRQYGDGHQSFDDALRESRLEMSSSMREAERRFAAMSTMDSESHAKQAATSGKWGKSAMAAAAVARKELKLQDEVDAGRSRLDERRVVKFGHERLWRLLGDRAIETLELNIAEMAFVMGLDSIGIDALEELKRTLGLPMTRPGVTSPPPAIVTSTAEEPIKKARAKLAAGIPGTPLTHSEQGIDMELRINKRRNEVEQKTNDDRDERRRFIDAINRRTTIPSSLSTRTSMIATSTTSPGVSRVSSSVTNNAPISPSPSTPLTTTTSTPAVTAAIVGGSSSRSFTTFTSTPTGTSINTNNNSLMSPLASPSTIGATTSSNNNNVNTPLSPNGSMATTQLTQSNSRYTLRAAPSSLKK